MTIHQNLRNAERMNMILMEDVDGMRITIGECISASNAYFTEVVQLFIYPTEFADLTETYRQNAAIIAQLTNGDITPAEACAQSNELWVARINQIRMPGIPIINTANFRSAGMSENF